MKKLFYLLIAAIVFTAGCKKIEKETEKTKETNKDLLIKHSWLWTENFFNGQPKPLEECEKDDYLQFTKDGNVYLNPGNNKCGTEMAGTATYIMSEDQNTITLTQDGEATVWYIKSINNSDFVFEYYQDGNTVKNNFKAK